MNQFSAMTSRERFLAALKQEEVDRPPVWMMRQAGRYLPEYRALRAATNTKHMMTTPEIACEITLQPITRLGVDAAILYSDILMIPDALGMGLEFAPGEGPKFAFALNSEERLASLNTQNLNSRLSYVFETIRLCIKNLPTEVPLLGFAGAPFTVACYMIAGKGNPGFSDVKALLWQNPKLFDAIMTLLTDATITYLIEQANSGVIAVQLFDTWAGLLAPKDYEERILPYTQKIFAALTQQSIPSIHYIKGGGYLLPLMAKLPSTALGVDWRVELAQAASYGKVVQGNLDPDLLLTNPALIKARTEAMLKAIPNPRKGYIANLGHGIGEKTPVENAQTFIETIQKFNG